MSGTPDPSKGQTHETAAELLKRRAGNAKPEDLLWYLDRAGATPPMPGDKRSEHTGDR